MERDDFQNMWAADRHRIDAAIGMNRRILHAISLDPALAAVRWVAVVELFGNAAAILVLGSFAFDHLAELRFALPAIVLGGCAIALLNLQIRQIVDARRPGYDEPITAVQKRLESLRIRRIRSTRWIFALAVLAWIPLQIVALKGLFGIDTYAFGAAYFWSNVIFGILVAASVLWASRTFYVRLQSAPGVGTLVRSLTGNSINEARRIIASIVAFESDASSPDAGSP
ncbi:MAG: hypothetical protein WB615_15595 [Candidatus Tumulicola sp.]